MDLALLAHSPTMGHVLFDISSVFFFDYLPNATTFRHANQHGVTRWLIGLDGLTRCFGPGLRFVSECAWLSDFLTYCKIRFMYGQMGPGMGKLIRADKKKIMW